MNSFMVHLAILLMHEDLLGGPTRPTPRTTRLMGFPPKQHQLARAIWYLSLQDCIDFWEIMQKMNCHGHDGFLKER